MSKLEAKEELPKGGGAREVVGSVPGKGTTYGFQELKYVWSGWSLEYKVGRGKRRRRQGSSPSWNLSSR